MKLSELNQKLLQAESLKDKTTKYYKNRLAEIDGMVASLKTNINSYVSLNNPDAFNQLKEATSIIYPLDYSTSIKSLMTIVNYGLNNYLTDLKSKLVLTLSSGKIDEYDNLLRCNLEIQDNSYGGDPTKYTDMTKKGYMTDYHPCLGGLGINSKATNDQLETLLLVISRIIKSDVKTSDDYYDQSHTFRPTIHETVKLNNYTKQFLQLIYPHIDLNVKNNNWRTNYGINESTYLVTFKTMEEN